MTWLASIRIALRALRVNKLRSTLTMLGIIIGVAAVITMIAVGAGAQARVEEQIKALGTNLIMLLPGLGDLGRRAHGLGLAQYADRGRLLRHPARDPGGAGGRSRSCAAPARWWRASNNWSTVFYGVTPGVFRGAQLGDRDRQGLRAGGPHRLGQGRAARRDGGTQPVRRRRPDRAGDPHPQGAVRRDRHARAQGTEPDGAGPGRRDPDADHHRPQPGARRQRRQAALGGHDLRQGARRRGHGRGRRARSAACCASATGCSPGRKTTSRCATCRRCWRRGGVEPHHDAAARRGRLGVAAGGRHRHHEHHAGVGDRAHARDRVADGGRRARSRHPVAVPGGGGDAGVDRRAAGHHARAWADPSRSAISPNGAPSSTSTPSCSPWASRRRSASSSASTLRARLRGCCRSRRSVTSDGDSDKR